MLLDSRYLVSIDALLDTRLGVLSNLDRDSAAQVMASPSYVARTMEDFTNNLANVSKTRYEKAWKERNKLDMAASVGTHVMPWLQKAIMDDMNDASFNFQGRKVSVTVNIWPYSLNKAERNELLAIMHKFFPAVHKVELWSQSPEQLSPTNLKSNLITTAMFYELSKWAEIHKDNLNQAPIPEVTMIGPELLTAPVDYSKVKQEHREAVENLGPFRSAELLMTPYYNLLLLPAAFFCACLIDLSETQHKGEP